SLLGALGMSLAYIPATMAAMSAVKPEETGLASGIVNTSYQIGSAIGLAVVAVIAAAVTKSAVAHGISETVALNAGFKTAFSTAAVICGFGLLIAVFRIKQPK
ncbi:MAG: hypothetical protein WKF91_01785, partial [Segetibacter sp.]